MRTGMMMAVAAGRSRRFHFRQLGDPKEQEDESMKTCIAIIGVTVLLLAAAAQVNAGPHWVDAVTQGQHTLASKGVFDLQIIGGSFFPGITLFGPTVVWNGDAFDTPDPGDPGHDNEIQTEMVSMNLTGGGITVVAGDGTGNGLDDGWLHSPGWVREDPIDPTLAESHFDVSFMITLPPSMGGMTLVNPIAHPMRATITEIPPQVFVYVALGQTELIPEGGGPPVAIITTATHSPEPSSLVLLALGGLALLRRRR